VAYRVVQMGLLPLGAFIAATHTRILEQVKDSRRYHLRLARRYTVILGAYSVVATALLILCAPLIPYLVGHQFDGSVDMTRWLAPLILLRSLAAAPMNGLLGLGRNTVRLIGMVVIAVISVVLYIVLVPTVGWKGAAVGTSLGEVLNVIFSWGALRHYQRKHDEALDAQAAQAALAR
jgi:O-antigen/teichoic acid export membrane protein